MESLINIGIILTYLMIGFATIVAIGFGIKKLSSNKKNARKTIYTVGGLLTVFLISYLTASDEILTSYEKYNITASTAKQIGMGLTTFYLLILGAIGSILYTEVTKIISK